MKYKVVLIIEILILINCFTILVHAQEIKSVNKNLNNQKRIIDNSRRNNFISDKFYKKKSIHKIGEQMPALPENLCCDSRGFPYFVYKGKKVYNPAYIIDLIFSKKVSSTIKERAFKFIKNRLVHKKNGDLVIYDYDYIYNDNFVKSGFSSAYSQSRWVSALIYLYKQNRSKLILNLLKRAVYGFFIPVNEGGILYENGDEFRWFEEIPVTHILNGNIRALVVLSEANEILKDKRVEKYIKKGISSLEKFFYLYDARVESRYDLVWNKYENMFRFHTENSYKTPLILINEIKSEYKDSKTQKELNVRLIKPESINGACRRYGDWNELVSFDNFKGYPIFSDEISTVKNNIKYGFFLEFPFPQKCDLLKMVNPKVVIKYLDFSEGTLELQLRDLSMPDRYAFFTIGKLRCSGDKKIKSYEFNIDKRLLTLPIGKYRFIHMKLMKKLLEKYKSRKIFKILNRLKEIIKNRTFKSTDIGPEFIKINKKMMNISVDSKFYDQSRKDLIGLMKDENIDTFFYSKWDKVPLTVEVSLNSPKYIFGLKLDWYSRKISPQQFSIIFKVVGNSRTREIILNNKNYGFLPFYYEKFNKPIHTDKILFVFKTFNRQNRLLLREIKLYEKKDYELMEKFVKSIYDKNSDYQLSMVDILKIGVNVKKRFRLTYTNSAELSYLLKNNVAQCGEYVLLFTKILNYFKIHTRKINLYNFPQLGDGHSTCEFYFDGKWRYYDPSFTFFVSKSGETELLSLKEIREHPEYADKFGRYKMGEIWNLKKRKIKLKRGILYNNGNLYTEKGIFKNSNPITIVENGEPVYFPIHINNFLKIGEYGETSNSTSSIDCDSGNVSGIPAGLSYLGKSLEYRNFQFIFEKKSKKWWEITIVPSYVSDRNIRLTLSCSGGIIKGKKEYHPNFSGFRKNKKNIFKFRFKTYGEMAKLNVNALTTGENSYISIDAIRVKKIEK